jgi:hypothetical protein
MPRQLPVGLALVLIAPLLIGQVGESKSGDDRVEKLLKAAELNYVIDSDGDFRLLNDVGEGRSQIVWILSNTSTLGTLEIREVWSVAMRSSEPLSAEIANRLLAQNGMVKLGAWQVRRMGENYVAIFSAQINANTDQRSLLLALHAVTTTADAMEKELTEKDDF